MHTEVSGRRQRVLQAAHYHGMPGTARPVAGGSASAATEHPNEAASPEADLQRPLAEYEALVGGGWS
jgi:hypothetical protein